MAESMIVDQLVDEVRIQNVTKHSTPKVRIALKYEPQAYPEKFLNLLSRACLKTAVQSADNNWV